MGSQIDWAEIVKRAWVARERAYAPYSRFLVGAAILAESGEIFTGCNVENISFGLTICAERAAVFAAINAGYRHFAGIAVAAETKESVAPCGACRQVLAEFDSELLVCAARREGAHKIWILSELLPSPFNSSQER
jgi:cytidine deaminase